MEAESSRERVELYARYPTTHILAYDGVTGLHYLLGAYGVMMGFGYGWPAVLSGVAYLAFAFGQMYIVMPLSVCPNCVYYRLEEGRCVSGNNRLSRRIANEGDLEDFPKRAGSALCHNNLYMASLFLPIALIALALVLAFSLPLLLVLLAVVGLLLVRFFVIFPKVACVHCMAKARCPNAKQMGLS